MADTYKLWLALTLADGYIQQGIPYKWNGKTPRGFDCSGLVCEILQSVGILPDGTTLNSRGLYNHFASTQVEKIQAGCLLFFGKPKISHVAMAIDDELMIEAGGGGSTTKNLADAILKRAFVRRRRIDRRSDLVAICNPF